MKINFPNKDAVYMHDTPLKSLFGRSVRFESSGCVRVNEIETLVDWILQDTGGWNVQRMMAVKQSGEQIDVKLVKPLPVYFTYISAWGTADGVIQTPSRHLQSRRRTRNRLRLLIATIQSHISDRTVSSTCC